MSLGFNKKATKNDSSLSIEQLQKQLLKQENQDSQNFSKAIMAGFMAAIVGAIIWAAVTYITDYQIGFMAIGIGFIVGVTINKIGKSKAIHFGIAGAVLALFGCLFGNLLTSVIYISNLEEMGVFDVLNQLDFSIITEIMIDTFDPMDLLFYGLAVYYGYSYAIAYKPTSKDKNTTPHPPIQS